jgi:glutaconate CoA-transferase subunit A
MPRPPETPRTKVVSLAEAVRRYVPDGATVALGTALECLIPFAAAHELIRQGRQDLTLVGPISDVCFDQLVAAGCARRIVAAWVGNVQHGSGYAFRRALEQGLPRRVEIEDHSNFSIALALEAAALGVPYLPTRSLLGSDVLARNPRFRVAPCPFTGDPLVLVPALAPDVAILHAQRADAQGSCHVWGPTGVSAAAGKASRTVIVVAEELVPPEVIRSDPIQGHWNRDHALYADWHRRSATAEGAAAWLDEWVRGPRDHAAYLAKLGRERLDRLRPDAARLAAPVDYRS